LKYGYSNFQLEILEYCTKENAISREQYYIDLLKPHYNLNLIAGSRLGSVNSEESRLKMSNSAKGRKLTEETKKLLSLANKGINNPNLGKTRSEKTKALYTLARLGKSFLSESMKVKMSELNGTSLSVLDLKTNETSVYPSIKKAAEAMGVSQPAITKRLSKNLDTFVVKKQYQVKKVNKLLETNDKSIDIVRSQAYKPVNSGVFNGKRSMSTSSRFVPVIPVKFYYNSDLDKELIVNENNGRTGVYR
jgi:group I intron endonuclease